jgi:hypothetical protein
MAPAAPSMQTAPKMMRAVRGVSPSMEQLLPSLSPEARSARRRPGLHRTAMKEDLPAQAFQERRPLVDDVGTTGRALPQAATPAQWPRQQWPPRTSIVTDPARQGAHARGERLDDQTGEDAPVPGPTTATRVFWSAVGPHRIRAPAGPRWGGPPRGSAACVTGCRGAMLVCASERFEPESAYRLVHSHMAAL